MWVTIGAFSHSLLIFQHFTLVENIRATKALSGDSEQTQLYSLGLEFSKRWDIKIYKLNFPNLQYILYNMLEATS